MINTVSEAVNFLFGQPLNKSLNPALFPIFPQFQLAIFSRLICISKLPKNPAFFNLFRLAGPAIFGTFARMDLHSIVHKFSP